MPDGHPEVTDVIVDLEEIDGKTHMKLTQSVFPQDHPVRAVGHRPDKLVSLAETG